MSRRPITVRRVKNAMEKAVALKGREYVYTDPKKNPNADCNYAEYDKDGKPVAPSCLVGHALYYLGVPLKELHEWEGNNVYGLRELLDKYEVPVEVRIPLADAQSEQDGGAAWGVALDVFHERLDASLAVSA